MTPTELAGRSDLLERIDRAVDRGTDQERLDLLEAAAIRIRAMNTEHDAVCADRAQEKDRVMALEAEIAGVDLVVEAPPIGAPVESPPAQVGVKPE